MFGKYSYAYAWLLNLVVGDGEVRCPQESHRRGNSIFTFNLRY